MSVDGGGALARIVDRGVMACYEAQIDLEESGTAAGDWSADLRAGTLTFAAPAPRGLRDRLRRAGPQEFRVQLLGSTAPGPRSWLWGWANPQGYPDDVLIACRTARALGQECGATELTQDESPFAPDDDRGTRLGTQLAVAAWVAVRSGPRFAGQALPFFAGATGGGSRAWLLIEGRTFAPPTGPRIIRVINEVLAAGLVTDHRTAVEHYLAARGIPFDGATAHLSDGELVLAFDDLGRLARMTGRFGPGT